ncbi:MAG: hypothetical protein RI554_11215, partial [Trueperaceae bacterium]|nr:hypothetical protein [Trueperaceae bacterium]
MTSRRAPHRSAAFLAGVAVSLLPALGPIGAAVLLLARGLRLRRGDGLWAAAAVLLAAPALVRGDPVAALVAAGTVVGPWVVYRTFAELGRRDAPGQAPPTTPEAAPGTPAIRPALAAGLLVGLAGVVIGGFLNAVEGLQFGVSRTVA